MRWILVLVVSCVLVSESRADDRANLAAANQALEAQLHGKLDDGPPTTADYLGVFPGHLGDGDAMGWRFGPPYIGTIKIEKRVAGWSGSWGWIAAELAVMQRPYTPSDGGMARSQLHRYHLVDVFVLDKGVVKLAATLLADTVDDAKLPAVEHVPGGPPVAGSLVGQLVNPGKVTLLANPNVAVFGSSAGELALGAGPAAKLLKSWGKLELSLVATPTKQLTVGDLGIAIGEVDLLIGKASRRLRAMVVAKKVGTGWEVAALAFGADTTFGDPR